MNKAVVYRLLITCLVIFIVIGISVEVNAQSNVDTFSVISVEPNPLTNQDMLEVSIQIGPAPPTAEDKFQRVAVTFTRPDGVTATNYYDSNSDGIIQFRTYSNPDLVGNWTLKVSFPGQTFANGSIYYRPSENQTIFTRLPAPSTSPIPTPWSTVGSWVTRALMPTSRGGLGVAAVDGKIYAVGGSTIRGGGGTQSGPLPTQGGAVGTVEEYDPATDTWTTKKPMPTPRAHFAIAVCQNKIYCISNGVNEVYDAVTDSWETKTPFSVALDAMQANAVGDKIYLIGYALGNSSSTNSRIPLTQVYDPETDSWVTKTHMPIPTSAYVSTVVDDKIYVIGSAFSNPSSNLNQIYDPQTDSWSQGSPLPSVDMYGAMAVATTGESAPKRIYVISDAAASNQIYDPKADSWTNGANLPTSRLNFGVGVVNDMLYVIGGQTFMYLDYPYSYPYGPSVTPMSENEQYIPAGYGTPDPAYQTPTATPSPGSSPSSTLNPTLTPVLSSPQSSSSSATAPASQQTAQSPEPNSTAFPAQTAYIIAAMAVITIIVAVAIVFRKRK
jgi:N-acetylneuraminic acid mutarotase